MLFAFVCKDKPGHLNVRMDTRPAHVEHLNKLNAEGTLKIAGRSSMPTASRMAAWLSSMPTR